MILGYHPSQAFEVHSRRSLFWACINWHVAPASQWSSTTSAVEKYRVTRTIFHYWKMNHSRTGSNCRQRKGEVTWRKAFEWGIEHFTYFISLWKLTTTRGKFGDGDVSFRHVIWSLPQYTRTAEWCPKILTITILDKISRNKKNPILNIFETTRDSEWILIRITFY